jgi:pimeloyl-ACP methyl ester carboxylesterase
LPWLTFWDEEEPSREVIGAAADGASKVIIKITGLPEDVGLEDVEISLPNGEEDGHLEDDRKMESGIFTQTYAAPKDFVRKGHDEDLKADKREIELQVKVQGNKIEHQPFCLFKPPVVLLHGIWGTPLTKMRDYLLANYVNKNRSLVYAAGYPNDVHFSTNIPEIAKRTSECIAGGREQTEGSIVVKKADIVAHSMGGILATMYAGSDLCQDSVNRIITFGTPHAGSEFANFAFHFLYEEMSDDQRRFNLGLLEALDHCVTRGAAEDLQVGSLAMSQYRDLAIHTRLPVYAIRCHHKKSSPPSYLLSLVYGEPLITWEIPNIPSKGFGLWYWDQNLDSTMTYFGGDPYDPFNVENGLFGSTRTYSGSDFIVSLESQAGGATVYEDVDVVDHMSETDDPDVQEVVVAALNSPVANFDQDGFSPLAKPAYPLPKVGTYDMKSNTWTKPHIQGSSSNEGDGTVTILSPSDGAVFAPGETVTVRASSTEPISGGMAFMSQDFSAGADDTEPYEFQFTIDPTYLGEMLIYAWFEPGDGTVKYGSIRVNVVTDQVPEQIEASPDGPLYVRPNGELLLRVEGLYPDGCRRDITSVSSTRYTSSDPNVVDVVEKGTLSSKIKGHAVVSVENSGVVRTVEVTVQPLEYGDVLAPVFRFWSPVHSRHFYTASRSERDTLRADYPEDCEPGLAAVYRFWSPSLSGHFYTISEAEKDMLIRDFPSVWTFEGTAFYAYPDGAQPAGTAAVYRFWSGTNSCHFYTISEAEKDMLIRDFPAVWTFEGIAWYAYPP